MVKAYVHSTKYRPEPAERFIRDVWFTPNRENAMYYETRQTAESDAVIIFERGNFQIDTLQGLKHTLSNFRVEERGPKEFVIFCEGPFLIKASTDSK